MPQLPMTGNVKNDNTAHVDIVKFASCQVLDSQGNGIKMATLWRHRPALFVFLRHFACIDCRAQAVQVWSQRERYEAKGARIIFIGNGQPNFIQGFVEELKLDFAPIFTDPTLQVFRAAGFRRGFLAALGPRSQFNGWKLAKQGATNGRFQEGSGDWWQMGGVTVIMPNGKVTYHHISHHLGDHPPAEEILPLSDDSSSDS